MTPFQMIPSQIDMLAIIADLRSIGWPDYKIEVIVGLGKGYIAQCRCGNIKSPAYDKAARLYNFWVQETQVTASSTVSRPIMNVTSGGFSATRPST